MLRFGSHQFGSSAQIAQPTSNHLKTQNTWDKCVVEGGLSGGVCHCQPISRMSAGVKVTGHVQSWENLVNITKHTPCAVTQITSAMYHRTDCRIVLNLLNVTTVKTPLRNLLVEHVALV